MVCDSEILTVQTWLCTIKVIPCSYHGGGENIPLFKSNSPNAFYASQSKSGDTMKWIAYRSFSTRKIYLVFCTTKGNGKSVEINFKP